MTDKELVDSCFEFVRDRTTGELVSEDLLIELIRGTLLAEAEGWSILAAKLWVKSTAKKFKTPINQIQRAHMAVIDLINQFRMQQING